MPSAIGGVPSLLVGSPVPPTLVRCHPPLPVPPTSAVPPTVCGAIHPCPVPPTVCGAIHHCPVPPTFAGATHFCRCHPSGSRQGAWHPIRPASRICGFLGSGGSPDTGCRRIACRCHPAWIVNMSRGRWFGRCCCFLTTSGNRGEELRWLAPGG